MISAFFCYSLELAALSNEVSCVLKQKNDHYGSKKKESLLVIEGELQTILGRLDQIKGAEIAAVRLEQAIHILKDNMDLKKQ